MTEQLDFEAMISPTTPDEFFTSHWQHLPLHGGRLDPRRLGGLIAAEDVEQIALVALGMSDPAVGVIAGRFVDGEASTWNIPHAAGPNKAVHAVLHAFAAGYSIVVNGVDRFWAPVGELTRQIESSLQQPVGANLYYSPADSQGFAAHFDHHDVLALQISGDKVWDLYPPSATSLEATADPWNVSSPLGPPAMQVHLSAGQVLYMPRGWTHRVRSGHSTSMHLTFGIRSLRWADLVLRAAEMAITADADLQRALPLHRHPAREEIDAKVASLLANLVLPPHAQPANTLMIEVLESRPPSLTGQIQQILAATTDLGASTRLRRRPGLRPIVTTATDEATIRFAANGVTAPLRFEPALELIAGRDEVTIAELCCAAGCDAAPLAQSLIINGLLVIVEKASSQTS